MMAMIFEFWFHPDRPEVYEQYLAESAKVRELLPTLDGFEGIERFQSLTDPNKYVSVGFFRDEDAVTAWRNRTEHRRVQALGRTRLFENYRLRMAEVVRDYGPEDRDQVPGDSRAFHDAR